MFKRLDNTPANRVRITIDGQQVEAAAGDTVAAAVMASGLRLPYTRTTPISAAPRAPFCLMGVCYECLMVIDGRPNQRACMTRVADGMCIERQQGTGELPV